MGRKNRSFRFLNGLNGVNRFYYPCRFTPPEIDGSRYLDITQEIKDPNWMTSNQDPNGSYTGVPTDGKHVPVQDADDL
ncbi:MAG TPA: hypothetical protein PLD48_02100 [Bacillota bacterium]|nr:hypothetical protein [Bacillota bacterium]HOK68133.1 hypothetical protein [Bacillota bacterium]HPP84435.1 hypothetical protein [Bacillota bacterium]